MVSEADGQNMITIVPGANGEVNKDYVRQHEDILKRAKVVLVQLEIPLEGTIEALRLAKAGGALTAFNPAPGRSDFGEEVFQLCDFVCLNETEVRSSFLVCFGGKVSKSSHSRPIN